MVPQAYFQAWTAIAPWPDFRRIEQDLIISRALYELFSAPALRERIVFRGSTAIDKLLFRQPLRYSEDISIETGWARWKQLATYADHAGAS